jgi:HAD superfamily hydrolase (TIGR01509 family)
MKTILVDAINGLVLEDGSILEPMHKLLENYPNNKIVLTGANDEQFKQFKLDQVPYEVFTLKHNPEKTDPEYFRILFEKYNLTAEDVVYFEHSVEAAKTAQSAGIPTYFYDHTKEDMTALKQFLDENLKEQQ